MLRLLRTAAAPTALVLAACAGCTSSAPQAADAGQARAALQAALDAWQRGDAPQALSERTPPIQFSDLHWEKGDQLLRYQIAQEETRGLSLRVTVKLALKARDGRQRDATTVYTADTHPRLVIVPEF